RQGRHHRPRPLPGPPRARRPRRHRQRRRTRLHRDQDDRRRPPLHPRGRTPHELPRPGRPPGRRRRDHRLARPPRLRRRQRPDRPRLRPEPARSVTTMTSAPGTPARVLAGSPALTPLLLRGALLSPFKRPRPDAAFPPTRLVLPGLRVDLARLAAYERVCGFPVGADHLPVTYPHVLGFPTAMRLMSGRAFPLPLLGLVHTSIRITRHHPVPATAAHEL